MQNSLKIFLAILYLRPNSRLGRLFLKRISRTEIAEGRLTFVDKNLV